MNTRSMIVWALPIAMSASVACSHESESNASTAPGISPVASYSPTPPTSPAQPPYAPATPPGQTNYPPSTTPGQQPSAQNEAERNPSRAPHDPACALLDATQELSDTDAISLNDSQKAMLHGQREKLEASKRSIETAVRGLRTDLANQVRLGAIDRAKVQADESAVVNAFRYHGQEEADVLETLHASLAPTDRSDIVAAARAERPGMAERQPNQGPWQGQSASERQKEHVDRLTRDLDLDAQQQQQVSSIFNSQPPPENWREEHAQRVDALLDAFQSDTFDARTAVPLASSSVPEKVHERVERRVRFLSQLLPILRPDQREKLASMIESDHTMERGHESNE